MLIIAAPPRYPTGATWRVHAGRGTAGFSGTDMTTGGKNAAAKTAGYWQLWSMAGLRQKIGPHRLVGGGAGFASGRRRRHGDLVAQSNHLDHQNDQQNQSRDSG